MTTSALTYPKVGDQSPDFSLPSPDGDPVSLSSYRDRKVILFMWASW